MGIQVLRGRIGAQESGDDSGGAEALDEAGRVAGEAIRTVEEWLNFTLFQLGEASITSLNLIVVVVIIIATYVISGLARRAITRVGAKRPNLNQSTVYTLSRLLHYVLLAIALLLVLAQFGIDTSKLAIVAGALGVGIGFGLQTIFNNFIAGLLLLFEKSLRVGDFIELESGLTGEVREINIRSTLIRTNDNVEVLVPNSEFVSGRVVNWTLRDPEKRMHVSFGVAYGSDKEKVREAALEAAAAVEATELDRDDRKPQVWLVEFGDSSLNFELVVWLKPEAVKRPRAILAQYNWAIETALAKHGLEIPFPQRDLHLRSVFQAKPDDPAATLKRLTERS